MVANAKAQGRVFVSIPGHNWTTFNDPLFRILLLRGFAWTAKEPVDRFNELVSVGATFDLTTESPAAPTFVEKFDKSVELPGIDVVSSAIFHDEYVMVGGCFSNVINTFRKDKKTGKLTYIEALKASDSLWMNNPAVAGQHTFFHMASGSNNVFYTTGTTFHADANNRSMGMAWYRTDPATGKSTLLGKQTCDAGNLATCPQNKKGLYLITQFPPAIQTYRLQGDGTPVKAETITGKGLGTLGRRDTPNQSGESPFAFSPDGLFLYTISDADKHIGWCTVNKDGSLTYAGSLDVEEALKIQEGKNVYETTTPSGISISPDGKHLYAFTSKFDTGLFKRDVATGALTYVSSAFIEKSELNPGGWYTYLTFTTDGLTAYYPINTKGTTGIGWCTRRSESGLLTLQGKVDVSGTIPQGVMLFDAAIGSLYLLGLGEPFARPDQKNTVQVFSTH